MTFKQNPDRGRGRDGGRACGSAASNVHDRPAGRLVDPLGGALKGMWEKAVRPEHHADARRGDRQRARHGRGQGADRTRQLEHHGRRPGGRPPYPKKVTKVCQLANLYPQYFQVVALADAKVNRMPT